MLRGGLLQIMTVVVCRIGRVIPQGHHPQMHVNRKIVGGNVLRGRRVRHLVLHVAPGPHLFRDRH